MSSLLKKSIRSLIEFSRKILLKRGLRRGISFWSMGVHVKNLLRLEAEDGTSAIVSP